MTNSDTSFPAVVTDIHGHHALLRIDRPLAGCGRCHEPGGCGGGLVNARHAGGPVSLRVFNTLGVIPGDQVLVEISPGSILKTAALTYGSATLLAILGAILSTHFWNGDSAAVMGALLGLVAGAVISRQGQKLISLPVMRPLHPSSHLITRCPSEEI